MALLSSRLVPAVSNESISTSVHQSLTLLRAQGSPNQEDVQARF